MSHMYILWKHQRTHQKALNRKKRILGNVLQSCGDRNTSSLACLDSLSFNRCRFDLSLVYLSPFLPLSLLYYLLEFDRSLTKTKISKRAQPFQRAKQDLRNKSQWLTHKLQLNFFIKTSIQIELVPYHI